MVSDIIENIGDFVMRCAKSNQDCDWCDKAWDCEIHQKYCLLERQAVEEGIKILVGTSL